MSILSHNVYDNVRTRVILPHDGALLLVFRLPRSVTLST